MNVNIPDALFEHIRQVAKTIHHGRIILEINADKPQAIDVIVESRERFRNEPVQTKPLTEPARVTRTG